MFGSFCKGTFATVLLWYSMLHNYGYLWFYIYFVVTSYDAVQLEHITTVTKMSRATFSWDQDTLKEQPAQHSNRTTSSPDHFESLGSGTDV